MKRAIAALLEKADLDTGLRIVLPDGGELRAGPRESELTVRFATEAALGDCLRRASLGFGEGYTRGEIEVEGPLPKIGELGVALARAGLALSPLEKLRFAFAAFKRRNTRAGARRNISAHYDVGDDFYELWLDPELQYSCAYFEDVADSLESAQRHKLDLVCRKLRLEPGMSLVDCGSGWGGLALHAARHYGVRVRGYTISEPQHRYSVDRAHAVGLGDRVEFVLDDYRNIGRAGERYDRFVSVGMFEHVGRSNWSTFFRVLERAVVPGGLSLVHSISRTTRRPPDPFGEQIFPGFHFPTLSDLVGPLERLSETIHVVDVENLRAHYVLTLQHWYERFQKNRNRIRAAYGEAVTRRYELYLACGPAWFRYDGVLLFQVLISHGFEASPPLTRRHMQGETTR